MNLERFLAIPSKTRLGGSGLCCYELKSSFGDEVLGLQALTVRSPGRLNHSAKGGARVTLHQNYEEGANFASRCGFKGKVYEFQ